MSPPDLLIGRYEIVEHVTQLLRRPGVRLVTVTGRSGVGKTAVAREVVRAIEAEDRVDIERAQVDRQSSRVGLDEVAAALSMPTEGPAGAPPRGRRRIVWLDGLEAVAGSAALVEKALWADQDLTVLAVSIVPLSLPAEHLVSVDPLYAPAPGDVSARALREAPAVRLLLTRIEEVSPDAARTADLDSIASLARLLDGLPLSLELAAARCGSLSVGDVLAEVGRMATLDILTSDSAPAEPHHRSLRATILWSYGLLSEVQQRLFRRTGVFAGPFDRDAVGAVVGDESAGGDLLDALVATGLARRSGLQPAYDRFELVPSVSLVARELLEADDELTFAHDQHAAYFLDVAAAGARALRSPDTPEVRRRLAADREEFVAAVRHLDRMDRRNEALRLMTHLGLMWEESSEAALAAQILAGLLPSCGEDDGIDAVTVAQGWALAAMVAVWGQQPFERRDDLHVALEWSTETTRQDGSWTELLMVLRSRVALFLLDGEPSRAIAAAEEGLAIGRSEKATWWVCQFLCWSAAAHTMAGNRDAATALASEGQDLALEEGDVAQLLRASHVLVGAAGIVAEPADPRLSEEELIHLARRVGDAHAESALHIGAAVRSVARGDGSRAGRHLREALELGHRCGLWYIEELALMVLVVVATMSGRAEQSARLHGAMDDVLAWIERAVAPEAMQLYRFSIDSVRTELGEESFDSAVSRGRLLLWDDTIALAATMCAELTAADPSSDPAPAANPLSRRERDVLAVLAEGRTNKEIAMVLGVRPKTVMHYTTALYRKLGVRNRTEAVIEARRLGLLAVDPEPAALDGGSSPPSAL